MLYYKVNWRDDEMSDYLRSVAYSEATKVGAELRPEAAWIVCDIWSAALKRADRLAHIIEMAELDDPFAVSVMDSNG